MMHVVCLKWGNKYPPEYVNKLYGMVRRNLTLPFSFHCMTENPEGLNPDINVLSLPELGIHGWWYKLYLFKKDFYGLSGSMLFLDLDIVITGSLNDIVTYAPGRFCIAPDKIAGMYNSSVMYFEIGSMEYLWESFACQKEAVMARFHGDQEWIQHLFLTATIYPYPLVVSYKFDCDSRVRFTGGALGKWLRMHGLFLPRKHAMYPDGARIVQFHGKPDPEDVKHSSYKKYRHAPWISQHWAES
jgi:hypothetical protein